MTKGELLRDCILHLGFDDGYIDPALVSTYYEYQDVIRKIIPAVNRCLEIASERYKLPIQVVEYECPDIEEWKKRENCDVEYVLDNGFAREVKLLEDGICMIRITHSKIYFRKPSDIKRISKCVYSNYNSETKKVNVGLLYDYVVLDKFTKGVVTLYYYPRFTEYLLPYQEDSYEDDALALDDARNDLYTFKIVPREVLSIVPLYVYSELKKEEQPSLAISESNKFFTYLNEIDNSDDTFQQKTIRYDFGRYFN